MGNSTAKRQGENEVAYHILYDFAPNGFMELSRTMISIFNLLSNHHLGLPDYGQTSESYGLSQTSLYVCHFFAQIEVRHSHRSPFRQHPDSSASPRILQGHNPPKRRPSRMRACWTPCYARAHFQHKSAADAIHYTFPPHKRKRPTGCIELNLT